MTQRLESEERVTDAIYDAGFSGPGRFYAEAKARLGMTPTAWRDGGRGETIRWAVTETSLGLMLVAATEKGICRLSFDEGEAELRARFPHARVEEGGAAMAQLVEQTVAAVEAPERPHDLPLDVRGTAFQEAVWRELSRVPPGESLSYAALAAKAGKPGAARAAGTACGSNSVAILIPCHRARRGDGSPGGYAWGWRERRGCSPGKPARRCWTFSGGSVPQLQAALAPFFSASFLRRRSYNSRAVSRFRFPPRDISPEAVHVRASAFRFPCWARSGPAAG
jgi:AraC family transcriptional regulator of adaptative response/methylated-DNA-[protein]-cysteine methyltransferase